MFEIILLQLQILLVRLESQDGIIVGFDLKLGVLDVLLRPFIIIFAPLQIILDLLICLVDAVATSKRSFQLGVIFQLLVQATIQPILLLPDSV
jgi:hypothetical protein